MKTESDLNWHVSPWSKAVKEYICIQLQCTSHRETGSQRGIKLPENFWNLSKRDSFELHLHEHRTSSTKTRLNSYDEEEPGEKVEPVLLLHAVWNNHKVVQLMDAEPAVKATQTIWAYEACTQWKRNVLTIIDKNLYITHMVFYIVTLALQFA